MLAIHNHVYYITVVSCVANAFAKLSKCQQFTTVQDFSHLARQLQTLLQSYQNVSNSQLYFNFNFFKSGCKRFCKVIKMLAIHNSFTIFLNIKFVANAFAKLSKCQQFTTMVRSIVRICSCKRFCKVIKMLAIHNIVNNLLTSKKVANAFAKLSKCQQFTTHQADQVF